jgi:hypothetical protein
MDAECILEATGSEVKQRIRSSLNSIQCRSEL